jgi:hypothetical protein
MMGVPRQRASLAYDFVVKPDRSQEYSSWLYGPAQKFIDSSGDLVLETEADPFIQKPCLPEDHGREK